MKLLTDILRNLANPAKALAIAATATSVTAGCAITPQRLQARLHMPASPGSTVQSPSNQAVIVAKNGGDTSYPGPWVNLDTDRLRDALEKSAERFQVRVVSPASGNTVSEVIQQAASRTAREGTLFVLFAGYANERGEVVMDDGSAFTWASMLLAVRPAPGFKRLVTVVSASLDAKWMTESVAMDPARTFPESVLATSVPRLFAPEGDDSIDDGAAIDEMRNSVLHPAASRMMATFRAALESHPGIMTALARMKENHELLYGPGPVIQISR